MQRNTLNLLLGAVLVIANVFALNGLLSSWHGGRFDLTERGDWTLAPETVEILREPEEPLELWFFHTAIEKQHQLLKPLVPLMSDTLREMQAASEGRVKLHLVEWDSADKDLQTRAGEDFGVKPLTIPISSADESTTRLIYFTLVVRYGDRHERFDMNELYRVITSDADTGVVLGLQNIEYLVAKGVTKVVRGFASIGASLLTSGETAKVTFVLSPAADMPDNMKDLEARSKKAVERLTADSGGKLTAEWIDPTGKSSEKSALRSRLRKEWNIREIPLDLEGAQKIYSWVIVEVGKKSDVFPMFDYTADITEAAIRENVEGSLKALIPGFLTVVGVISPDAKPDPMAKMMGRPEPPSEFRDLDRVLGSEYEVKMLDMSDGKLVPSDVSVLLVLRPKDLSERTLWAIDRFVMRGGRLVVCADTHGLDVQGSMQEQALKIVPTDLGPLKDMLRSWGADIGDDVLVDTRCDRIVIPKTVNIGGQRVAVPMEARHPALLYFVQGDGLEMASPLAGGLKSITMGYASPVNVAVAEAAAESRPAKVGKPDGVVAEAFMTSSAESGAVKDVMLADATIEGGYRAGPEAKKQPVALHLRGRFPSWFAGKPIPGLPAKKEGAASRPADEEDASMESPALSRETTVVVFGDADFVSPLYLSWSDLGGIMKSNLAILKNAIDIGGADPALLKIRSKEDQRRPLVELRKIDESSRASATQTARWKAIAWPIGLLVALAVGWRMMRANRSPMDLPVNGG